MVRESVAHLKSAGKEVMLDLEHFFDGWKANSEYTMQVSYVLQYFWVFWLRCGRCRPCSCCRSSEPLQLPSSQLAGQRTYLGGTHVVASTAKFCCFPYMQRRPRVRRVYYAYVELEDVSPPPCVKRTPRVACSPSFGRPSPLGLCFLVNLALRYSFSVSSVSRHVLRGRIVVPPDVMLLFDVGDTGASSAHGSCCLLTT